LFLDKGTLPRIVPELVRCSSTIVAVSVFANAIRSAFRLVAAAKMGEAGAQVDVVIMESIFDPGLDIRVGRL